MAEREVYILDEKVRFLLGTSNNKSNYSFG